MADALLSVEIVSRMETLSAGLKRAQQEILSFVSTSDHAIRTLQGTLNSLGFKQNAEGARQFTGAVKDLGNTARKTAQELKGVTVESNKAAASHRSASSAVTTVRSHYGDLTYQLRNLAMQYFSLQAGIQAVQFAFSQNIKVDSIRTSLKYMLGDAEEADVRFKRLRERASALGVEYTSLGQAYQLFIGSAKASGYDMAVSEKIFYSLAKAGAVLHMSQEKVAGSLYAVQQMMDKGTVQSEELKRQLGNNLPGALAIMAKAVGVSNAELMVMMKRGELLSSEILPKFAEQVEKSLGIESVTKVESLQASFGRLKNAITDLLTNEKGLASFFQTIVDGLTDAITQVDKLISSKSWQEFVARLMSPGVKLPDTIRNVVIAREEGAKAASGIKDVSKLDRTGLVQEEAKIREAINALVRPYNDAMKMIKKGEYAPNDPNLKKIKETYNYLQSRLWQISLLIKGLPKAAQTPINPKVTPDSALRSIAEIRKRIAELSKMPGSADIGSEIYERIQRLKARLSGPGKPAKPKYARQDQIKYEAAFDIDDMRNTDLDDFVRDQEKTASELYAANTKVVEAFNVLEKWEPTEDGGLYSQLAFINGAIDEMLEGAYLLEGASAAMLYGFESMGQALARGDGVLKAFGNALLGTFASFLSDLSKLVVKKGMILIGIGIAENIALPGSGMKHILSGAALIAAGAALAVGAGFMGSNPIGGGSGKQRGNVAPGFANGVTNFGGGLALVGERGPELVTLPRGGSVTPSNRTEQLLNGGTQIFIPDMVLRGEDIYVSFKKTERKLNRV